MSGRVLVIAYYFPPLGGVGVQRTLKYVKYLPSTGWQPIVVAPAKPAYNFRDEALLDELAPDLQVERTASFEPARLPNAVAAFLRRRQAAASGSPADATAGPAGTGLTARLLSRGMSAWKGFWGVALFPDAAAGWIGPATRRGLAVHRRSPVDVVYSTSAPISCHLIARQIARRTGLPWIADFRDPWIGNAFATPWRGIHAVQQRRMERQIVTDADLIVFVTQGNLDAYAERYPSAAHKMRVIPNGYDRDDFPRSTGRAPGGAAATGSASDGAGEGPFRLVYTGSLFGERELGVFLAGLELLAGRRPDVKGRLEIEFVGWLNAHNRAIAASYAHSDTIGSMLRFSGFLPRAEVVKRAADADALLQLVADAPGKGQVQGGKLMEYLGYDRQILAVVPEGQARDVLRELDWGIVADPTPEGVAGGLERLLSEPLPTGRADPEGRYDRVNLAGRLAGLLDDVPVRRRGGSGTEAGSS